MNIGVSNWIWNAELEIETWVSDFLNWIWTSELEKRTWISQFLNWIWKAELESWNFNENKQSFWFSNWDEKIRIKIGWNLDSNLAINLLIIGWKSIEKGNEIS